MKTILFFLLLISTTSYTKTPIFTNEWQAILIEQNGAKTNFSNADWQNFADTTTVLFFKQTKEKNALTDFKPILRFKKLRKLYLNHNQYFKNIEKTLQKLVLLEVLELESTKIKNLKFARKLTQLRRLDIRNTAVSSLDPLVGLPNISMILCIETKIPRESILKISGRFPKECRIIRDYTN